MFFSLSSTLYIVKKAGASAIHPSYNRPLVDSAIRPPYNRILVYKNMLAYSYGLSYVSLASQIALTTQRLTFDITARISHPMTPSKMIIYFQLRQV